MYMLFRVRFLMPWIYHIYILRIIQESLGIHFSDYAEHQLWFHLFCVYVMLCVCLRSKLPSNTVLL